MLTMKIFLLASAEVSAFSVSFGNCTFSRDNMGALIRWGASCEYTTGSLILYNQGISSLSANVFKGMGAVTGIFLGTNKLSEVPADVFSGLSQLVMLDLSNNQLKSVPVDLFSGLSKLSTIYLDQNQLVSIPTGLFSGLVALSTLSLEGNELTDLPVGLFHDQLLLSNLNLINNKLKSLPPGTFSGLNKLIHLSLRHNQLTTLNTGFSDLSALTSLDLNYNLLTWLPYNVFIGLSSLRTLKIPTEVACAPLTREQHTKLYVYEGPATLCFTEPPEQLPSTSQSPLLTTPPPSPPPAPSPPFLPSPPEQSFSSGTVINDVIVKILVTMPISVPDFDDVMQKLFKKSMASAASAAAGMQVLDRRGLEVKITKIEPTENRRRHLLAVGIKVHVEVSVTQIITGWTLANYLTKQTLDVHLAQEGLPQSTVMQVIEPLPQANQNKSRIDDTVEENANPKFQEFVAAFVFSFLVVVILILFVYLKMTRKTLPTRDPVLPTPTEEADSDTATEFSQAIEDNVGRPSSHAEMVITIDDYNKPLSEKDDVFRKLSLDENSLSESIELYAITRRQQVRFDIGRLKLGR